LTSAERPPSALDTNHGDDASLADTLALAEAAEAEAEAAEAEARAAAARARAIRLRREADAAPAEHSDGEDDRTDAAESDGARPTIDTATTTTAQSRRPQRLIWRAVAVSAGILLICLSLVASGYMVWQDRIASQQRQRTAEFATAARQDVTALMSLDFKKTDEDLQRIADNSTGNFKSSFPVVAEKLTKGLEQSRVTTTVTVNDVAVESMTDNSAIVLVAATTEAKGPDGPPQLRSWHLALGLRRDGGKPKMANIEFVQ
jgi:Mce-associated membrane protein